MIDPVRQPLESARRVFDIEARAVAGLSERLDEAFAAAVQHVLDRDDRVIVCGMGKSGIIGRKIAATLASTGTPSFFLHPGEAYHGDLGMVRPGDTVLAISNSGETEEVVKLLPFLRSNDNGLIALTGNATSTLARAADFHLDIGVEEEACPLQLAPTASTTATLAMGDAFAVALMDARGFAPEHFARFHPGGALGRRLLSRVEDQMVAVDPTSLRPDSPLADVIAAISSSRLGLALVELDDGLGIVTDGDLRRGVERYGRELFDHTAADILTREPQTVAVGTRVEDAVAKMDRLGLTSLLVLDGAACVGILKK